MYMLSEQPLRHYVRKKESGTFVLPYVQKKERASTFGIGQAKTWHHSGDRILREGFRRRHKKWPKCASRPHGSLAHILENNLQSWGTVRERGMKKGMKMFLGTESRKGKKKNEKRWEEDETNMLCP